MELGDSIAQGSGCSYSKWPQSLLPSCKWELVTRMFLAPSASFHLTVDLLDNVKELLHKATLLQLAGMVGSFGVCGERHACRPSVKPCIQASIFLLLAAPTCTKLTIIIKWVRFYLVPLWLKAQHTLKVVEWGVVDLANPSCLTQRAVCISYMRQLQDHSVVDGWFSDLSFLLWERACLAAIFSVSLRT